MTAVEQGFQKVVDADWLHIQVSELIDIQLKGAQRVVDQSVLF